MKQNSLLAAICVAQLIFSLPCRAGADEVTPPAASPVPVRTEPVYGRWRACRIGDGGYHRAVILCPSNPCRYYTYIDTAGVFRSDDSGETWKLVTDGMQPRTTSYQVRSVMVDPRNENILLAAFSEKNDLYRSTDGGNTWRGVLSNVYFYGAGPFSSGGSLLASQPGDPDLVLAATQGTGIFKSTDGGKTWAKKGLDGIYATGVIFDRKNPRCAWLSAVPAAPAWGPAGVYRGGLFVTEDSGETWQPLGSANLLKLTQDPIDADTLYAIDPDTLQPEISRDRGKTWSAFTDGLLTAQGKVRPGEDTADNRYQSLAVGPDFILCGTGKGTIYRLDHGQTRWQKIDLKSVQYGDVLWSAADHPGERPPDQFGRKHFFGSSMSSITIDLKDAKHWLITDWFAIYQSHDGGANWKLTVDGIESTAIQCVCQDPSDPKRVYLSMSDIGYFYSADGGVTFLKPADFGSGDVKWVDVSPKLPDRVWAVGNRSGGIWNSDQIFVSTDRGQRWKQASMKGLPSPATTSFNILAVNPGNPDDLYVGASGVAGPGKGGVYRSQDGGATWSWFGNGLSGRMFGSDFWTTANQIAINSQGGMMISGPEKCIPQRLYGDQWVGAHPAGWSDRIAADWQNPGVFYLGVGGQGIYRSEDGGKTWNLVYA